MKRFAPILRESQARSESKDLQFPTELPSAGRENAVARLARLLPLQRRPRRERIFGGALARDDNPIDFVLFNILGAGDD